jgi:hypothetical protein
MISDYILMCKEAKEIQELWEPKVGDRIINKENNPHPSFCLPYRDELKQDKFHWIPRQEDLQSLCMKYHDRYYTFDVLLDDFCAGWNMPSPGLNESFDEYWLLFTMDVLFDKEWNHETKKWQPIEVK